ncbi:RHS repeat-associated core domain-containing protein [Dysgonomonas sp. HDW5B]|uniref:RHS repeat-associated core domain-containing protein n=1 Tax=Dysgonomonas sp. HDW5B TaxID=2714927 RepID=UPI00140A9A3D|nr:RHS repeat-associated core domain-containing protein [Dysgonomonas sp. HDW5B]QIK53390.1 RHS repeat-associated core domain-containing protein [Dysgonomonas sp. HDW5B]
MKSATYKGDGNFQTSYSYDKMGNIKTIQRYGVTAQGVNDKIIDNLTLDYTGNQLNYITDTGPNVSLSASADFKDYSKVTTAEYTFNKNGAMTKDLNKGIQGILYNSLNLPQEMVISHVTARAKNYYTYTATGTKLRVIHKSDPALNGKPELGSTATDASLTTSVTTDYVGNKIYEAGTLKTILTDNGYIEGNTYYFYIKDHLSNNRIVANGSASVVQSNQYYPFGMAFAEGTTTEQGKQEFKYNGKELDRSHELNQYDYSARYYDPGYSRFTTMDPHSENYYSWSPYVYVGNNPMRFIDPTGMDWYKNEDETAYTWREGNDATYTQTIGEGDNAMTMTMTNIGETYVDNLSDGTQIVWNQNSIGGISEPQSLNQGTESLIEGFSRSNNLIENISYNILNDVFVSIQPFTFGIIGGNKTNEFTGGGALTNLDGSTNYNGIGSFISTISWFVPVGNAGPGLQPLKTLNAAQFSRAFKGSLSRLQPAARGAINKSMNKTIRTVNSQIGSGNLVTYPIGIGSSYKVNEK